MVKATKSGSSSDGVDGNQDGLEVHDHQEGYDCDDNNNNKESLSGADKKKEGEDVDTIMLGDCGPAVEDPP